VLTRDHTDLPATNTLIHQWNEPTLAFTPQPQSVTALWPVLIFCPAEGRRLSWLGQLVTHQDGIGERSPISVLTGLDREQLRDVPITKIANLSCDDRGARWRGGATVRHLCLRSVGRGFKSYSRQRCATILGKLFTPTCLCHQAV